MPTLLELTRQARALADGAGDAGVEDTDDGRHKRIAAPETEAARQLTICNACRYCEGFCAVFPAMTRRLSFDAPDVHYLANLCHNCGACLHACQYAPPHDFGVNIPQAMARVRAETYTVHAWPTALGALYRHQGVWVALVLAGALALFLIGAIALNGTLWHKPRGGNFYSVFPHGLMVGMFAPVFAFAVLALGIGVVKFWRGVYSSDGRAPPSLPRGAWPEAIKNGLTLKYLDGGHGEGCNDADDAFTLMRRRFHHLTFYGFMLCFAATCVATVQHYVFDWPAPYPLFSAPVLLGVVGGLGLVIGPIGLGWLHLQRHAMHRVREQSPMDLGFIALLFANGVTGLALLAFRDTGAMALWLAVHLGCVMALFITMPYGKFAHGIYRLAALLKWAVERRQPDRLKLGE